MNSSVHTGRRILKVVPLGSSGGGLGLFLSLFLLARRRIREFGERCGQLIGALGPDFVVQRLQQFGANAAFLLAVEVDLNELHQRGGVLIQVFELGHKREDDAATPLDQLFGGRGGHRAPRLEPRLFWFAVWFALRFAVGLVRSKLHPTALLRFLPNCRV